MRMLLSLLLVGLLAAGCQGPRTVVVKNPPGPGKRTVVVHDPGPVTVVHVHDARCGHFWNGVEWVRVHGHVHGPGCGHHFHSGGWHLYPVHHVYKHPHHHHHGVKIRIR